jgi:predicted phosphodiesterase
MVKKIIILIIILFFIAAIPSFIEIYRDIHTEKKIIPINKISKKILLNKKLHYPIKIAILGDSKKGTKVLEHIVEDAKKNGCQIVFHLGDIIPYANKNFYKYYYSEFLEMINNNKIPIFIIPGDHEISTKNERNDIFNFNNFFGKDNFILNIKNFIFLCMNDTTNKVNKDFIEKNMDIISNAKFKKFVLFHIPTRDFRKGHHHSLKNKNTINFLENFIIKNHFSAVFCSHIHSHGKYYIKNIPCYISGMAGAYLIFKRNYSYLILTINKNGSFSIKRKVIPWEYGLDFQDYFESFLLKLYHFMTSIL